MMWAARVYWVLLVLIIAVSCRNDRTSFKIPVANQAIYLKMKNGKCCVNRVPPRFGVKPVDHR